MSALSFCAAVASNFQQSDAVARRADLLLAGFLSTLSWQITEEAQTGDRARVNTPTCVNGDLSGTPCVKPLPCWTLPTIEGTARTQGAFLPVREHETGAPKITSIDAPQFLYASQAASRIHALETQLRD